jgi:hypothetical protein
MSSAKWILGGLAVFAGGVIVAAATEERTSMPASNPSPGTSEFDESLRAMRRIAEKLPEPQRAKRLREIDDLLLANEKYKSDKEKVLRHLEKI